MGCQASCRGRAPTSSGRARPFRGLSTSPRTGIVTNALRGRAVRTSLLVGLIALALSLTASLSIGAQRRADEGAWTAYAGGVHGGRYSPLDQITKENVKDLRIAWRWASVDRPLQADPTLRRTRQQDTPLMVNGVLYTVTGLGQV